jgi:hypothetical protein
MGIKAFVCRGKQPLVKAPFHYVQRGESLAALDGKTREVDSKALMSTFSRSATLVDTSMSEDQPIAVKPLP